MYKLITKDKHPAKPINDYSTTQSSPPYYGPGATCALKPQLWGKRPLGCYASPSERSRNPTELFWENSYSIQAKLDARKD
ncbi:hypothetical protein AVEN_142060-1 [Araneus ventricosus]|uniref:Uncharacterized protein n=1 Tax=Araneus ventricosus TaxID=182803 RepID=A0A4Y2UQC4_ARAVE|nr:hypothetical protein AVEN_142060-1 [Araneus ventricosus]